MIIIINNLIDNFDNYEVKVFDTLNGNEIKSFHTGSENFTFINQIEWSPDNKRIYVIFHKYPNFHSYCFDIHTGALLFSNIFYAGVAKIFLSQNNKLMCIAHNNRQIEILNALTGELLNTIDSINGYVIKFSQDSNHLIIQTYSDDVDEYMSHQNRLLDIIKFNFNTLESQINDEKIIKLDKYMHTIEYSSIITIAPVGYIKKICKGRKEINGQLTFLESGKYCIFCDGHLTFIFKF
jgi:hypothetical protein